MRPSGNTVSVQRQQISVHRAFLVQSRYVEPTAPNRPSQDRRSPPIAAASTPDFGATWNHASIAPSEAPRFRRYSEPAVRGQRVGRGR